MSKTVEFPEGLLVQIEDDDPNLSVQRKDWGDAPTILPTKPPRPLRALLNFEIVDCVSGESVGREVRVTLVARYLPSDVERAQGNAPRLMLYDGSEWVEAAYLAGQEPKVFDDIHDAFGGIIRVRNVPVNDPPAALG